ncbi:MAG TPA: type II toxin-antitoxin system VapC family toxin [Spirochaetales bacterium]|nr:type II toxin-antitoxin system VapC family toxin [Spirochaetales bacterium]
MKYLLDSHVFLWWANEPEKLPQNVLRVIKNPHNTVFISTATSWEVQIKESLGRITFLKSWEEILRNEIEKNYFLILPITLEHTFVLKKLPPLHKDPFDRILIAQSIFEDLTLITSDPFIRTYPGVSFVWE